MMKAKWYQGKVIHGKNLAKTWAFPTLNLDNPKILLGEKEGVYACRLKIKGKFYNGLLYFGPRLILGERENVLEIFVFDFGQQIYGETVYFQLIDHLRGCKNFPNLESFKKQLVLDCQKAKERLKYKIKPM